MGKLALAAKVTHVPSLYLSELPGKHQGCRQAAIDGHFELGRRCKVLGVDTVVVFDVHWLVNAGYHVNCAPKFKGVYTSNELPHFIKNMPFEYDGNPRLGRLIAETATTVAILASGSLSHRFNDNGSPEESIHEISDEFYRQIDLRVVELWQQGDWKTFVKMLPTYNATCHGEGHMHDTAMLLGALGWDAYDRPVEIVTPYFASSGTGQINAVFPVTSLPR